MSPRGSGSGGSKKLPKIVSPPSAPENLPEVYGLLIWAVAKTNILAQTHSAQK